MVTDNPRFGGYRTGPDAQREREREGKPGYSTPQVISPFFPHHDTHANLTQSQTTAPERLAMAEKHGEITLLFPDLATHGLMVGWMVVEIPGRRTIAVLGCLAQPV